jgi:hypothetical protein
MAEGFDSESSPNTRSDSPWTVNVTYLSELYKASLIMCDEFLDEFCQHARLLYGGTTAERLHRLGLDERSKRLIGILLQLGNANLLSSLDGVGALRLMDVDFLSLRSCTELSCGEIMALFIGDDGLDLGEVCASIRFIYGSSFEFDFQN